MTSSPYPPIERWMIPTAAIVGTIEAVQRAGMHGNEAGALWLGRRAETAQVSALVLPQGEGVKEAPQMWDISPEVFGSVSRWASPQGLVMLGMVHTHGGATVAMSWSDRHRTVQVPGILSVIIGHGGRDRDPVRWGWYVYEADEYRELDELERRRRISFTPHPDLSIWLANRDQVAPLEAA